jgi:UDP-N-acetylmuramyl pentapeptide phosphotransferase/UDP-N-acetylglucosamine-1-phosphate transferase
MAAHLSGADMRYAIAVAMVTALAGFAYRRIWRRIHRSGGVPTGFGVFIAPAVLGAALTGRSPAGYVAAVSIIFAAAALYWMDDVRELSARTRVMISLIAGGGIGAACFANSTSAPLCLAGAVAAGIACVVATNIVNFYDGADLNLATFIGLTASLILSFGAGYRGWEPAALSMLAFLLPFAVMNSRPDTIYLGDSGSFAFAGLLVAMGATFVANIGSVPPEAALPAALPTVDVFFVFIIRVRERHDLLSRNYLHLYQRLNRTYAGFGYLAPQFVNVLLCLAASALLQTAGLSRVVSTVVAMIGITIPFYFVCRFIFLSGEPARRPSQEV